MKRKILIFLFALAINTIHGQNYKNLPSSNSGKNNSSALEKAIKGTREDILRGLAVHYTSQYNKDLQLIKVRALDKGWVIKSNDTSSIGFELKGFTKSGFPVYYNTLNNGISGGAGTSSTNALWPHGSLGLNLSGENMKIAEWDEAAVRGTHIELANRVTQGDGIINLSPHSTHVAGTLISAGIDTASRGMSFKARLEAYDWNNDFAEMCVAASKGLLISNHSYGYISGWKYGNWSGGNNKWHFFGKNNEFTGWMFGSYAYARDLDLIAYNAPYYTIVKAAGNDHNQDPWSLNPGIDTTLHFIVYDSLGNWVDGGPIGSINHPARSRQTGYDLLDPLSNAKNIITVANVFGIAGGYTLPSGVILSSSSSWGKTDDGRIKPDICAKGTSVYSTYSSANNAYATMSGTSMASPMVAGALLLLEQHYRNVFGEYMRSATLRGLIIHTADECGTAEGPDYKFGWGLLNTKKAALAISLHDSLSLIKEKELDNGSAHHEYIFSKGTGPLIATICWTDPQGPDAEIEKENSTLLRLVNDLDIRITKGGTTWKPYILDPLNPGLAATKGDNVRDNVEKIYISTPDSGFYTITVSHKGNLAAAQAYSLIITGISNKPPAINSFFPVAGNIGTEVTIHGANFTGITSVKFGTTEALSYTVDSLGKIRAFVPPGALTGKISIKNSAGICISSTDFCVNGGAAVPVILSFSPVNAGIDNEVFIYGKHFADAFRVRFNNATSASFTVFNDTVISAKVPPAASTGRISVTTSGGTGFSSSFISIRVFYCYIASDNTGALVIGPAAFSPDKPGVLHSLSPSTSQKMISAGTWAKGRWLGAEYLESGVGGNLYEISPDSGRMSLIGSLHLKINGLAYDEISSTLFGVTDTKLYSINPLTADTTLIGNSGLSNSVFLNLACNSSGQLFSVNYTDDNLYTINKTNGTATLVGHLGIHTTNAQDMEFDKANNILYMAGYIYRPGLTDQGNLYTLNTTTGSATFVGTFQDESQITGLSIPYYPMNTTFTGNGNWSENSHWDNGKPGSSSNAFISGNTGIDRDASCNNLVINSNYSVTIPENNTLAVNGYLTLKSDISGSASFIDHGLFYTPNPASIERYITPLKWHLISSPVNNALSQVFTGAWMMDYNEGTNRWNAPFTNNSLPLHPGKGFALYDSTTNGKTFVFEGRLNSGNITPDIIRTDTGYNLIGNPYPSALSGDIHLWTKSNVDNAIWVWDETNGNYKTWNGTSGTLSDGIIPSMQGFFVKANANSPSVTIPQTSTVYNNHAFYKSLNNNELILSIENHSYSDALLIAFNNYATSGFDHFFDVEKLYGLEDAPQIYSLNGSIKLSINGLPADSGNTVVPIFFEAGSSGIFTLKASGVNSFNPGSTIILEDLRSMTSIDLKQNQTYIFNGSAADDHMRFLLHFNLISGSVNENNKSAIHIFSYGDNIFVDSDLRMNSLDIYNIAGQLVYSSKPERNGLVRINLNENKGCYIVRVFYAECNFTEKVMLY